MYKDISNLKSGDALLLHGCCHNPTGADLSIDQWSQIAYLCKKIGILPFVDLVYQGLGLGINEDVLGIQNLINIVPEAILTVSSSKTFGVYRDRCGLFAVITDAERVSGDALETMLSEIARELYFHPPDHAASIINILLASETLKEEWLLELSSMRNRIVSLDKKLANHFKMSVKLIFLVF